MKKILTLALVAVMLFSLMAVSASAAVAVNSYEDGKLSFSKYTESADHAFDGSTDTAYDGCVIGMFEERSVVTGITVKAAKRIVNMTVKGSVDGEEWIELYSEDEIKSTRVFGGTNNDNYSAQMLKDMYSYAFNFLKFEMEYGSISEISVRGYAVDIEGELVELDRNYVSSGIGFEHSGVGDTTLYSDDDAEKLFDHVIGAKNDFSYIGYKDAANKFAYVTAKLKTPTVLSEIAFAARTGDSSANCAKLNGAVFEASVDGQSWDTLITLAGDLSTTHALADGTIHVLKLDGFSKAYNYVRLSSTKNALTIGLLDFYGEADAPSYDADEVCNDIDASVYLGADAPSVATTADSTTAAEDNDVESVETTAAVEEKKGCRSSFEASTAFIGIILFGAAVVLGKCRRHNI